MQSKAKSLRASILGFYYLCNKLSSRKTFVKSYRETNLRTFDWEVKVNEKVEWLQINSSLDMTTNEKIGKCENDGFITEDPMCTMKNKNKGKLGINTFYDRNFLLFRVISLLFG